MMGLTMCEGKFVGRDEIAMVPTPTATASWKPVPHSEVIDAVTDVVRAHRRTADVRHDPDQQKFEHGVEPLHRYPQQS